MSKSFAKVLFIGLLLVPCLFIKKYPYMWRILWWWIAPVVVLVVLKQGILEHFFILTTPATIILIAVICSMIFSWQKIVGTIIIGALIAANLYAWYTYIPTNSQEFFLATQSTITLEDEQKVIQTVYNKAQGKPFIFRPYTIPYDYPKGWEYLLSYYGKPYGYQPLTDGKAPYLMLVIQDDENKKLKTMWLNQELHSDSKILSTTKQGAFTILVLDFKE